MAKHIVFLVHGMGAHYDAHERGEGAWDAPVVRALDAAWKRFPALAVLPREELIEYVPITYDQIFREYLSTVANAAERVRTYLPSGDMQDVMEVFQGAGSDDANFLWANIMDVLDYRYGADRFRLVHAHIAHAIVEKANAVWAKQGHANATFSVISHSLGTAAVHGALNRLGGGNIGESAQFKVGGLFRLRSYVSIANVSRVLWDGSDDLYKSTICRPFSEGRGYVDEFLNVGHIADPIIAPMPFSPQDWGPAYRALSVQHIRGINVHDFCHYIEHPAVSGNIFRSVLGGGDAFLPAAELKQQIAAYPDVALADAAKQKSVERLVTDISRSLRNVYGSDQALVWSLPRLVALTLRSLLENVSALRPLFEAT